MQHQQHRGSGDRSIIEADLLAGRYPGVILDIDGTLIDSNEAHAHAWRKAFQAASSAEARLALIPISLIRKRIGMGGDQLIPALTRECLGTSISGESPLGKLVATHRREIFSRDFLPKLRPLPGARELIQRLQGLDLRIVVATSSEPAEAERLLKLAGVDDLLSERVSKGPATRSKPAADIVCEALEQLPGVAAVMIGDTPYDIESARRAGIPTIAFRSGGFSDAELRGAIAIYDGAAQLAAALGRGAARASA